MISKAAKRLWFLKKLKCAGISQDDLVYYYQAVITSYNKTHTQICMPCLAYKYYGTTVEVRSTSDGPAKLFLTTGHTMTPAQFSGYPVSTIDVINCVRDFFNNLVVTLTTACVTYFRTCVTPLLLNDLDLPTNSHSSLQRLINLKICLFATDFHISS